MYGCVLAGREQRKKGSSLGRKAGKVGLRGREGLGGGLGLRWRGFWGPGTGRGGRRPTTIVFHSHYYTILNETILFHTNVIFSNDFALENAEVVVVGGKVAGSSAR